MRIFYFAGFDVGASEGGRGQHVEGVIRGLHKLGWEVVLFSCKDKGDAKQPDFPFENILIPRKSGSLKNQFIDQWRLFWKLAFWRKSKPDVIYIRNRFCSFVPVLYARLKRIPYFYEINGIKGFETNHKQFVSAAEKIENWYLRHAAGIIPVTVELRDHFARRAGIKESCFQVIHNGADPSIWTDQLQPLIPKAPGAKVIGFVGHFQDRQGLDIIIRALPKIRQHLPSVHLIAAGTGGEKAGYEKLIKSLNLSEFVHFPGYIQKDNLGQLCSGFDVTVAPYTSAFAKTGTGLSPLKLFTYLACERIVVASDLDGLKEFRKCPAVMFAQPDSMEDFTEKLVQALTLPEEEKKKLGKEARQYILENFTWDKVAGKTANFIMLKN